MFEQHNSNRNKRNLELALDFDLDDCYIDSNNKSAIKYGFKKYKQLNAEKIARLEKSLARKSWITIWRFLCNK